MPEAPRGPPAGPSDGRAAAERPRASVVIPSWNGAELLPRVLASLDRQRFRDFETIVVDNGSTDGSMDLLRGDFPTVRTVALPFNTGFAGAVNAGIAVSRGDVIALLNNDAVADPDWLAALVGALDAHPEAGSVASRMLDLRDPRRIDSAGDQLGLFPSNIGRGEPDGPRFARPAYVLSACAGAAAYRRALFDDVGLLDERFFAYMEDVDLGIRAQLRGWDCLYVPEAVVHHEGARTSDRIPERKFFLLMRNSLLVFFQYMPPLRRLVWAPAVLARVLWNGVARGPGPVAGGRAIAAALGDWHRIRARRRQVRRDALLSWRDLGRRLAAPLAHSTVAFPVLAGERGARRPVPERGLSVPRTGRSRPGGAGTPDGAARGPDGAARGPDGAAGTPAGAPGAWGGAAGAPGAGSGAVAGQDGGPAVDVVIVNWNGARWLPGALAALARSAIPVRVILVDNASTDGSLEVAAGHPDIEVVALDRNAGYAGGANEGLARSSAPFALVMNPDVLLEPDHLERLRARLLEEPAIGAAQGKLYQISPEGFLADAPERRRLDSAGHAARPTRMVVDRGQGAPDAPAFDRERSVFSATGAALFLRRTMLDDIAAGDAPFDPAFFAYKEDIDLCWRARLHGWDVRYVPSAVGHHVRAMPGGDRSAWRGLPVAARRHSWKNHYLMILKNDPVRDLLRSLPSVLAWEAGRLGFALARDPAVLPAYLHLARLAPSALRARRRVLATARRRGVELHAWFGRDSVPAGVGAGAPGPRPIPPGGP